jgi:hypothetical protein
MRHSLYTTGRSTAAALFTLLVAAAGIEAQELPEAGDVIARYQQAIGGADVLKGHTSIRSTGEFAMPAAGIVASFESVAVRPNRSRMRVEIPGFGEMRSGYTGEVAWAINPAEGPRLMDGAEARQAADEADFESALRLPRSIESMTTVERTTMGGRECLKVRLQWRSGRETFDCYSTETGLLIGSTFKQESHLGSIDAIVRYEDYREFGGMLLPTRVIVQAMGIEQVFTFSSVQFDAVPESELEPPAEITALISGR